jgi:hypothetical protein
VAVWWNVVPVAASLPLPLWEAVGDYALTAFAPGQARIVILSGTVSDRRAVATALWKVLVASDPAGKAPLRVEAFLVEPGSRPAAGVEGARIRLADLERRAGLDFGADLRAQDAAPPDTPDRGGARVPASGAAGDVVALLAALDAPTREERVAAAEGLRAAFARGGVLATAQERAAVLRAMLDRSTPEAFAAQTPDGRLNLALTWSGLPPDLWRNAELAPLRAEARRSLLALRQAGAAGRFGSFSRTDALLAQAIAASGAGLTEGRRLFIQFEGYEPAAIERLAADLRPLGWTVPPIERIRTAAGQNELRHNPADAAVAALLLGDIAQVWDGEVRLRPTRLIPRGSPELWVSAAPPP